MAYSERKCRGKTSGREAQEDLERLVGTPIDLEQDVHALTLSVRQWIVIARALLRRPSVVVFDESTAALDYASSERFFQEVRRLRDAGVCVVMVTHRISELTGVCDRVRPFSRTARTSVRSRETKSLRSGCGADEQ